ncbi:MAG: hypothetical protein ACI4E0_13255 [Blautia sp.]
MSAELIQNSKNAAPDQNAGAAFQYTTGFYFCTEEKMYEKPYIFITVIMGSF